MNRFQTLNFFKLPYNKAFLMQLLLIQLYSLQSTPHSFNSYKKTRTKSRFLYSYLVPTLIRLSALRRAT